MSLRAVSSSDEISFLSILLLVGMLGILVALGAIMLRKETQFVICTPGLNQQSQHDIDAIHIRIQFTPQQMVHRRRAPSVLDLGPAAAAAAVATAAAIAEVKKDI